MNLLSEASFISAGGRKGVAGKNGSWRDLVAAVTKFETSIVYRAKIAFGIKELARGREIDRLHAGFRNFALVTAEPAALTDAFPGFLVEQIHL